MPEAFPAGVVVFFRIMAEGAQLARAVHPTGRKVSISDPGAHPEDYVISDGVGKPLAFYPRDFVAAIMPLETEGPANANRSREPDYPETPTPRNPSRFS